MVDFRVNWTSADVRLGNRTYRGVGVSNYFQDSP